MADTYDALDLMAGFIVTVSIVCLIGGLAWLAVRSVKRRFRAARAREGAVGRRTDTATTVTVTIPMEPVSALMPNQLEKNNHWRKRADARRECRQMARHTRRWRPACIWSRLPGRCI